MDDFSLLSATEGGRRGPGRPQKTVKTEQITLTLPAPQRELLEELTQTGYFGRNAVDTATMLLWQALNDCAPQRLKMVQEFRTEHASRQLDELKDKMKRISQILNEE